MASTVERIDTTFLVVGAGPAGASLACFLASHGLTGIMLSSDSGTTRTPKAHITNPAALECLRDIGLEEEASHSATHGDSMQHYRWGHDMAGVEYARIHSWGHLPRQRGAYESASPCRHVDLPQTLLEPILVQNAIAKGWTVRFHAEFQNFARDSLTSPIISTVRDTITGHVFEVSSKYLFGCDGARSQVMRQLDIPLIKQPGQGLAFNIIVNADLSAHVRHRNGNLHWCLTPELVHPPWGWACVVRMVKAWHQWMFIMLPQPGYTDFAYVPSNEECTARIRQCIGDASIAIDIVQVSKWYINEIVAERYSDGNIFCAGDAVHRHPPFNGLGSNTCIQDGFNLAWKLAYVEKGLAGAKLLESFGQERQPIGAGVIQRANQGLRDHNPVLEALGMLPEDVEERKRQHAELSSATPAGRARRQKLREGVEYVVHETSGIGIEMNQQYRSEAVYLTDETASQVQAPGDAILEHQISTYPGSRLPHAWLNTRSPGKQISTIDLAGHGNFCVLTGVGGEAWKTAAVECARRLGIPIKAYSIGWMQDWEDVYDDWAKKSEIDEDGCVLVRPDRTVCWRSSSMRSDCTSDLLRVLSSVLSRV